MAFFHPFGVESIIQLFGLINEHDGDVVANLVEKLALLADKAIFCFGEPHLSFAFWAGQDVKQFLTDHGTAPVDGNRRLMGVVWALNSRDAGMACAVAQSNRYIEMPCPA